MLVFSRIAYFPVLRRAPIALNRPRLRSLAAIPKSILRRIIKTAHSVLNVRRDQASPQGDSKFLEKYFKCADAVRLNDDHPDRTGAVDHC
jgi:hypothetical protein